MIWSYNGKIIYLGKFNHDRALFSRALGIIWFILGKSSPFMAKLFRLVNYYNLSRYMVEKNHASPSGETSG